MRYSKYIDWFTMWLDDKKSMTATMYKNLASDLDAGYDPRGKSITEQKVMIRDYEKDIDNTLDLFKTMEADAVNRWCFYDMIKRGVIA